jgi:hypothetical protein
LISPAAPPTIRLSEPPIEVSGVRSSWLTVEMNSVCIRSICFRSVMSWMNTTNMCRLPASIAPTEISAGKVLPSFRRAVISRATCSEFATSRFGVFCACVLSRSMEKLRRVTSCAE